MRTDTCGQARVIDDPSNLFDLLSDSTRVAIVLALAEADTGLSFSELARRLEVDDTGRLNYHLKRLRGQLVVKEGDGYVLTDDGTVVLDWIG